MATTESAGRTTLGGILGIDLPSTRISSTTVNVAPDMAAKLLADAAPRYQRESQQATIDRYADTMRQGYWHISTIRMAVVVGSADFFNVNGKHRLNAVTTAGIAQDFQVEVVLCDTEDEVRELVAVEDRGKIRTAVDVADIVGLSEELGLGRQYGKLSAAIGQIVHGFTTTGGGVRQQMAHEVWERSAKDWVGAFKAYQDAVKPPEGGDALETTVRQVQRRLQTPAMIGLGMILLRSKPDQASQFLTKIASGHIPGNPKDPIRQLVNMMAGNGFPSNPAVVARTVAVAWNAFVQNHQLTHALRPVEKIEGFAANKVPLWLIGTPYTATDHAYYTPTPSFPVFYRDGAEVSPQTTWDAPVDGTQPRWKMVFGKGDTAKAKKDAAQAKRDSRVEKTSLRAQLKEIAAKGEAVPKSMADRATELGLAIPKPKRVPKTKATKAEQPTLAGTVEQPAPTKRGRKPGSKIDHAAIEKTAFKKPTAAKK